MKVAFTEWNGRIAPVFDVSNTALLIDTGVTDDSRERDVRLPLDSPSAKVAFLADQGVDLLVCGAITRQVQRMAEAEGIQVYPFVSSNIKDAVDAWMHGRLDQASYSMPGCRRCRHRLRERSGRNNK